MRPCTFIPKDFSLQHHSSFLRLFPQGDSFFFQILNALERLGYRVVSSSCMITGFGKHDTRDFVWTMHKAKDDWEASSK